MQPSSPCVRRGKALVVLSVLAMGGPACLPGGGGVAVLREYTARAEVSDYLPWPLPVRRSLDFRFESPRADEGPERCVSLAGARVTLNGAPVESVSPGRWDGVDGTFAGPVGCYPAWISIPLEKAPSEAWDAVLEIAGDGERFRMVVPGLYRKRELDLVRVEGLDAVFRASFPLTDGHARARSEDPNLTGYTVSLPARIDGDTIRVDMTKAPDHGGRIKVRFDGSPPVATCEGFAACQAELFVSRDQHIPSPP
jgi:hypothetical protein